MITTRVPTDWRDLQNQVARILEECRFTVATEVRRETVRGTVEFDVFGHEEIKGRTYSIACECKHWSNRVPQSVVHSFRTTVQDIGANVGYIVSIAGFQAGAHQAAEMTNIKLVSWSEFQMQFEETWYRNYLAPTVAKELKQLLTYTEPPFLPAWFNQLAERDQRKYCDLKRKYVELFAVIMSFTPYVRMLGDRPLPELPISKGLPPDSDLRGNVPNDVLNAEGYREFLVATLRFGNEVTAQFRKFRSTVVQDEPENE